MLNAITATIARLRDLAILGCANESKADLVIVETEREAHYEPSNSIIRLIIVNSITTTSDIEPAVSNEVSKRWQITRQRSILLILSLIQKRPLVSSANTQHQFLAVHPSLRAHVLLIVDTREVEWRLESRRNVCRRNSMLGKSFIEAVSIFTIFFIIFIRRTQERDEN
jgi:hypothetical protein